MARACYRERNTLLGRLKDNKAAREARVGGVPRNPSGRCLYAGWLLCLDHVVKWILFYVPSLPFSVSKVEIKNIHHEHTSF